MERFNVYESFVYDSTETYCLPKQRTSVLHSLLTLDFLHALCNQSWSCVNRKPKPLETKRLAVCKSSVSVVFE